MDYKMKLFTIAGNGRLGETTLGEYLREWRTDDVCSPQGVTAAFDWMEEEGKYWTVVSDWKRSRQKHELFDTREEAEETVLNYLYEKWVNGSLNNDAPMTFDSEQGRIAFLQETLPEQYGDVQENLVKLAETAGAVIDSLQASEDYNSTGNSPMANQALRVTWFVHELLGRLELLQYTPDAWAEPSPEEGEEGEDRQPEFRFNTSVSPLVDMVFHLVTGCGKIDLAEVTREVVGYRKKGEIADKAGVSKTIIHNFTNRKAQINSANLEKLWYYAGKQYDE